MLRVMYWCLPDEMVVSLSDYIRLHTVKSFMNFASKDSGSVVFGSIKVEFFPPNGLCNSLSSPFAVTADLLHQHASCSIWMDAPLASVLLTAVQWQLSESLTSLEPAIGTPRPGEIIPSFTGTRLSAVLRALEPSSLSLTDSYALVLCAAVSAQKRLLYDVKSSRMGGRRGQTQNAWVWMCIWGGVKKCFHDWRGS